jgi:hypothetical protein
MNGIARLRKILGRAYDPTDFAGERKNCSHMRRAPHPCRQHPPLRLAIGMTAAQRRGQPHWCRHGGQHAHGTFGRKGHNGVRTTIQVRCALTVCPKCSAVGVRTTIQVRCALTVCPKCSAVRRDETTAVARCGGRPAASFCR